jgi:phosphatidate cytidylyltransferase
LSAAAQTVALFGGVFAILAAASLVGFMLQHRLAGSGAAATIDNLNARVRAWWVIVALLGLAFAIGKAGVILFFAFASFAGLREFLTLTTTRRGDHWALAAAFFVVLPVQYYLIWIEWYGLYSIFIPVYVFLLLPLIAALRGDVTRFMERIAELQWGLMIAVFCLSHVPALLTLPIPGFEARKRRGRDRPESGRRSRALVRHRCGRPAPWEIESCTILCVSNDKFTQLAAR